ncbi:MAG: hypothetical protein K2G90_00715 [Muribaculaceae bacterium]|nr:hypothetical protein [Muribaculaceae bacterium]
MGGWIALSRDLEHHWLWHNPRHFQMWVKMLFLCQWEDGAVMIGKSRVEVKRGQFATTMRILSSHFQCGKQCTMDFLKTLEEGGMIRKEIFPKYTLITVLDFMEMKSPKGLKNTPDSRVKGHPPDPKSNRKSAHIKENNNKENSSSSSSREEFEKIFKEIREDEQFWMNTAGTLKKSAAELRQTAEDFFRERLAKQDDPAEIGIIKPHLFNWLRKSQEIKLSNKQKTKQYPQKDNGTAQEDGRLGFDAPPYGPGNVPQGRF